MDSADQSLSAPTTFIAKSIEGWARPNRETNEARGRGFLHGAGRTESWAPHDIRYVVPTGPPSHFPPSVFLPLGTASSLSGAEIEGPKFERLRPRPSHVLCTRPHGVAGPQRKSDEVRGGGSCRFGGWRLSLRPKRAAFFTVWLV
jgi:hypothetical protein